MPEKPLETTMAKFDKCPVCGSTERAAQKVAEEERAKGRVKILTFVLAPLGGPIFDPSQVSRMLVGQRIPVVVAYADVCLGCGTIYAVKVGRQEAPLMAGPLPPQGPVFSPQ